jgi:methyl-accepting chemotaxis protein
VPSLDWGLTVKQDCSEAMAAVEEMRAQILMSAIVIALLALLASVITAHTLVQPLQQLKEATDRISKGDVDINLDIRSGDEIGDLGDSFERMIAAIRFFREQSRLDGDEIREGAAEEARPGAGAGEGSGREAEDVVSEDEPE